MSSRSSLWPGDLSTWVGFTTLYAAVSTLIHRSFVVTAFDNAIMEQVVARYAQLQAPITEVEGAGFNYFGDHFSPVLALYAPFYRLAPAPETLFVVQASVLAAAVVVVRRTAVGLLGGLQGNILAILFGLSFGMVHSVVVSARETPFAVLLLALAGAAYVRGSTRGVVWPALGLLLVKEDMGLTTAAVGAVLILANRSRRAGAALIAAGAIATVLVVWVVTPAFGPAGGATRGGQLGSLASLLDGGASKTLTLVLTFGVVGFVALRSWWVLVVGPTLAWRFAAAKPSYWSPFWHYSAPLMPVVFVSGAFAMRSRSPRQRAVFLGVGALITALTLVSFVSLQIKPAAESLASSRPDQARRVLDAVPAGARVVSDEYLVAHLTTNRVVYYLPMFGGCPRPDYVVAHVGPPQQHIYGGDVETSDFESTGELLDFADETYGGTHEVVVESGGYVALRRLDAVDRCR